MPSIHDDVKDLPAKLRSLSAIVEDYEKKVAAIHATVAAFGAAVTAAEMAATIAGTYGCGIWGRGSPSLSERDIRASLLQSAWRIVREVSTPFPEETSINSEIDG